MAQVDAVTVQRLAANQIQAESASLARDAAADWIVADLAEWRSDPGDWQDHGKGDLAFTGYAVYAGGGPPIAQFWYADIKDDEPDTLRERIRQCLSP